jgi:hypothetical protein
MARYLCTDAPDRHGKRMIDANAGHVGEWPETPRRTERVPEAGGVNPQNEFGADRRRLRGVLRDEEAGNSFGLELYLPHGGNGFGSQPPRVGDRARDAALLSKLQDRDPFDDCASLGALQRLHDRHYRRF